MLYCVIMAGGSGTRLWPLSLSNKPKQFIDLVGVGRTMLQLTFDRFRRICPADHFVVVTLDEYRDYVKEQLPEVPEQNILCEPFRKNTAACIAFATAFVKQLDPNAVTVVTPSDHLIMNNEVFTDAVADAIDYVTEADDLLSIGIKAFKPDTAFGYIQVGEAVKGKHTDVHLVRTFTEKPNAEMAQMFYELGDFCWNSGVFVWRLPVIEEAFKKHMPELHAHFSSLDTMPFTHWYGAPLRNIYEQCEMTSVDYGVMEKADNVVVRLADAVWSDLGGWEALYEQSAKDTEANAVVSGSALLKNASGNLIHVANNEVCIVDSLSDFMVVHHDGVTIICPRENGKNAWRYYAELKAEQQ